ncbi:hypothetical protein L873DRAFT_1677256, partial [Choiromyces venosus 120613-1]
AATHGHESIVRLLLICNDINPNKPDIDGQIPLLQAASFDSHNCVGQTANSKVVHQTGHQGCLPQYLDMSVNS